jgi:hypothetical protein
MSFRAGPRPGEGGVPVRPGLPRWVWWLFWPKWHQELLALALIIITVAAGLLLARH